MSAMMVPDGWEIKRLGELVDIVGGGTPARDIEEYWKKGSIPWVTVKDLHHKLEISNSEERITEFGLKNSAANLIPSQNIITPTRMSLGRFFINSVPITINQDLKALKPKKTIFPLFLLWNLLQYGTKLEALGTGTTVKGITLPDLKNLQLPVPSFPEQQKIATIFSTLDRTIEATQKLIDKEKMVKKGLMADLLTHGIDEQGRIRSPQTHTYVDSPLGMIPEGWEIVTLNEIAIDMKSGLSRKLDSEDIGIPVLRSNNITDSGLNLNDLKYWYIEDPQGAKTADYHVKNNDILINFINSLAQIGKVAKYSNQLNRAVIYTTNILKFSVAKTYDTDYILYSLQTERYMDFIQFITKPAVNQASFTTKDLKLFKLPAPSLTEQQKIAAILSVQDRKIETEEINLDKLQNLKKGLMGDLLSGKVRVKING